MNASNKNPYKLFSGQIAVIGIPFDDNSSFMRGAAQAPPQIREAFYSSSSNLWTEAGRDLLTDNNWHFVNEPDISGAEQTLKSIENNIGSLLSENIKVISLGGDHSITYPVLRSYSKKYNNLNVLHLDAHPDLYDELDGNRFSHACPFARIMEEKLVKRVVQVGIRAMNGTQRDQARRFGVEVIEMRNIDAAINIEFQGPVYLSLDLDCLDPAYAPGVSHYEPGGMSTRQVINIIQNLKAQFVGADIVEYNPIRDPQKMTAMVAAKLLKEILGRLIDDNNINL